MSQFLTALGFLFGLVIGSFLNVVIARFGSTSSPLRGRSRCPECGRRLTAWELIPLVSYLMLRGRCRTCRKPIGLRYPLIELATGLATALIVATVDGPLAIAAGLVIVWTGLVILAIDLTQMLIPDLGVVILAVAAVVFHAARGDLMANFPSLFLGALVGGGVPLLIILASRGRGMGLGDVKLGAVLGFLLGWPLVLVGLFASILLGALVGGGLVALKVRQMRDAIPFGPFLLLGALFAILWGMELIQWYLDVWF